MAKMNFKKSFPGMQTVTPISGSEMTGVAAGATSGLANSAVLANIQGGRASLQEVMSFLTGGGGVQGSAVLSAMSDAQLKQLKKQAKKFIQKQTQAQNQLEKVNNQLAKGKLKGNALANAQKNKAKWESQLSEATGGLEGLVRQELNLSETLTAGQETPVDALKETLQPTYAEFDKVKAQLDQQGAVGPLGQRFMTQMGQGFQAGDISWQDAQAATSAGTQLGAAPTMQAANLGTVRAPSALQERRVQSPQAALGQAALGQAALARIATGQAAQAQFIEGPQAAMAQRVADASSQNIKAPTMGEFGQAQSRDISAGNVGQGALGAALMNRALQGVRDGGRLSAEASRDATQAARQGLAARGMATGGIGMASELLNRDRYRREREMQDLQFATGTQAADQARQFQNVGNRLTADQSNQSASMQAELANLQARYNRAVQNGNWELAADAQNQESNLRAQLANQSTAANLSLADQSATNQARTLGYQGAINQSQFNAGNRQQMNLANLAATNQGNQFNAANRQQMGLANMSAQNAQGLANQAALNRSNEFGAQLQVGQTQFYDTAEAQRRALAYQGSMQQREDMARRMDAASANNQSVLGQFLLNQGQLNQQNNQFNAGQLQQTNQFNAQGRLNAQNMQQENLRLGAQLNAITLGQGMGAEQLYQDRGLGASLQRMGLETQMNPTLMALGLDPFGGRTAGTQAMGPAANMANTWATNATEANMFNANANNWGNMARWSMGSMPSMQSGSGAAWGGLAGAGLGAGIGVLGAALAPATFGTSLVGAGLIGAGLGGSVGASAGGLFR